VPVLRPRTALSLAFACLLALAFTGVLAYLIPVSHVHDSASLAGFEALNRPRLTPLISHVAHLADPGPYAFLGLSLALIAAVRGRGEVALAIVALLLVTGATTHFLKPLLAHPRYAAWLEDGQVASASWPSGHATASMTLALCAVMAVPAKARPMAAALGALFAIAVSYSILALGWHFPSDVIGGFLVATMWTLVAVAVLTKRYGRSPVQSASFDFHGPLKVLVGLAGAAALVVMARPHQVADFALERPSFVFGAGLIAAMAGALAVGLARGLRS